METAIKYKQMVEQDVTQEVEDLVQFIKHVDPYLEKAYGAACVLKIAPAASPTVSDGLFGSPNPRPRRCGPKKKK